MARTGQHQRCISAIHWVETSGALALGAILVTAAIGTSAAQTYTYTVLHEFKGYPTDGANPFQEHLIGDSAGNLYGTTASGGASASQGVLFKLGSTGETVLYNFTGPDGKYPYAGVIRDSAGNLYGTTYSGGASGYGVVFKLDTTGTESVLYSFTGGADGASPYAALLQDSAGNLYGTATGGGIGGCIPNGCGVVFKLDTTGTETVLYSFTGGTDGGYPGAGLIQDAAGNLYSTTFDGGASGAGVVFKLDTTGTETVLYSFTRGADGGGPKAGLIRDSAGNLYGTTEFGGASGFGVVFKLGMTGTETVLYSFTGGADGANFSAGLIADSAGNLYGTTASGGASSGCGGGCGVVFKLDTTGTETVLHSFTGGAGGAGPSGGLSQDSTGNLYGTAEYDGVFSGDDCKVSFLGCGVVFKLQP